MSIFFRENAEDRSGAIEGIPEIIDGASDAIIGDQIAKKLTSDEISTFANSDEAKELIAKELVQEETIEAMKAVGSDDDDMIRVAALNIAKNKEDPKFAEAVEKKQEVEEIIDDIVDEYQEEAEAVVESFKRKVLPHVSVLRERMTKW